MAIELFTAEKLLEFAFSAVVAMGVEKLTQEPAAQLWRAIRNRLQGEPVTKTAIAGVERHNSREALSQLVPFLQVEMVRDPQFKQELQQLAHQINTGDNIRVAEGIGKAETRDHSIAVGKVEGGIHFHYDQEESPEKKP